MQIILVYPHFYVFFLPFLILEFGYFLLAVTNSLLTISNFQTFLFKDQQTETNIRMTFDRLHTENQFILISIQLIKKPNIKIPIHLSIDLNIRYFRNKTVTFNSSSKSNFTFNFNLDSLSQKIIICDERIHDFDSLFLFMTFQPDFERFTGLKVNYLCLNPNGFILLSQSLNQFIIISFIFIFFYYFLYHGKITVYFFLLLFSLFASNPFRLLHFERNIHYKVNVCMTCITFSLFLGFQRYLLYTNYFNNKDFSLTFVVIIFLFIYSICEIFSKINEFLFRYPKNSTQLYVWLCHFISLCLFVFIMIKANKSSRMIENQRRFAFYALIHVISLIVTVVTQIICPYCSFFESSLVPIFTYYTTHMLIAYALIYIHRPVSRQEILESDFRRASLFPY